MESKSSGSADSRRKLSSGKRLSSLKLTLKRLVSDKSSTKSGNTVPHGSESDEDERRISTDRQSGVKRSSSSSSSDDEKKDSPNLLKKQKMSDSDSSSSDDKKEKKKSKKKKLSALLKSPSKKLQFLLKQGSNEPGKFPQRELSETGRLSPLEETPSSSPMSNPRFSTGTQEFLNRLWNSSSEATSPADLIHNYNLNYRGGASSPIALIHSLNARESSRDSGQLSEISLANPSYGSLDFDLMDGASDDYSTAPSQTTISKVEKPRAYLDEKEGAWRCESCGWTYPVPNPSSRQRRQHSRHCREFIHVKNWLGAGESSQSTALQDVWEADEDLEDDPKSTVPANLVTEATHPMANLDRDDEDIWQDSDKSVEDQYVEGRAQLENVGSDTDSKNRTEMDSRPVSQIENLQDGESMETRNDDQAEEEEPIIVQSDNVQMHGKEELDVTENEDDFEHLGTPEPETIVKDEDVEFPSKEEPDSSEKDEVLQTTGENEPDVIEKKELVLPGKEELDLVDEGEDLPLTSKVEPDTIEEDLQVSRKDEPDVPEKEDNEQDVIEEVQDSRKPKRKELSVEKEEDVQLSGKEGTDKIEEDDFHFHVRGEPGLRVKENDDSDSGEAKKNPYFAKEVAANGSSSQDETQVHGGEKPGLRQGKENGLQHGVEELDFSAEKVDVRNPGMIVEQTSLPADDPVQSAIDDMATPAQEEVKSKSNKVNKLVKLNLEETQKTFSNHNFSSQNGNNGEPNELTFSSVQKYWADVSRSDYLIYEGKMSPSYRSSDENGFPPSWEGRRLPSPLSQKTFEYWNAKSFSPLGPAFYRSRPVRNGVNEEIRVEAAVLHDPSPSSSQTEQDLEEVVKNQTSHDLICPVCGSCVTKRIILRKRKRSVVSSGDARSPKAREIMAESPIEESMPQSPSPIDDKRDEAWGCLACFSFFFRGDTSENDVEGPLPSSTPVIEGTEIDGERVPCLILFPPFSWGPAMAEPESTGDLDIVETSAVVGGGIHEVPVDEDEERVNCLSYLQNMRNQGWVFVARPAEVGQFEVPSSEAQREPEIEQSLEAAVGESSDSNDARKASLACVPIFWPAYSWGPYVVGRESELLEPLLEEGTLDKGAAVLVTPTPGIGGRVVAVPLDVEDAEDRVNCLSYLQKFKISRTPTSNEALESVPAPITTQASPLQTSQVQGETPPIVILSLADRPQTEVESIPCLPVVFPEFSWGSSVGPLGEEVDRPTDVDVTEELPVSDILSEVYEKEPKPSTLLVASEIAVQDQPEKASFNCLPELPALSWGTSFPTYELPPSWSSLIDSSKNQSTNLYISRHPEALAERVKQMKGKGVVVEPASAYVVSEGRIEEIDSVADLAERAPLNCLPILLPAFDWGSLQSGNSSRLPSIIAVTESPVDSGEVTRQIKTEEAFVEGTLTTTTKTVTLKQVPGDPETIDSVKVDQSYVHFEAGLKDGRLTQFYGTSTPTFLSSQASTGYALLDADTKIDVPYPEAIAIAEANEAEEPLLRQRQRPHRRPRPRARRGKGVGVEAVSEEPPEDEWLSDEELQSTEPEPEAIRPILWQTNTAQVIQQPGLTWSWPSNNLSSGVGLKEPLLGEKIIEENEMPDAIVEVLVDDEKPVDEGRTADVTVSTTHTVTLGDSKIVDETSSITQQVPIAAAESQECCECLPAMPCTGFTFYDLFRDHDIAQVPTHPILSSDDIKQPLLEEYRTNVQATSVDAPTIVVVDSSETIITVAGATDAGEAEAAIAAAEELIVSDETVVKSTQRQEILKSIVYGGLDMHLVSFGFVSSAAGGDAKTITVLAMGVANVVFGMFTFYRNILSLYYNNREEFLQEIGQSLPLNGFISLMSFLFFGLLAPITYAFSFREAENRDLKYFATSAIAFCSVVLLGGIKAYVKAKSAVRVISTLVIAGILAAIAGYITGTYVEKFLEMIGFESV